MNLHENEKLTLVAEGAAKHGPNKRVTLSCRPEGSSGEPVHNYGEHGWSALSPNATLRGLLATTKVRHGALEGLHEETNVDNPPFCCLAGAAGTGPGPKPWMKEIGERVKERMVEIQKTGL